MRHAAELSASFFKMVYYFRGSRRFLSFGNRLFVFALLLFCALSLAHGGNSVPVTEVELPLATRLWPSAESEAEWRRTLNPELTRLVEQRVSHTTNTIIVLVANEGFERDAFEMVCNLHTLGIDNYLVVALDDTLAERCHQHQVPVIPAKWLISDDPDRRKKHFHLAAQATVWATPEYKEITRFKPFAVHLFLLLGVNVLMTDADIAWLRDPLDYLEEVSRSQRTPLIFQNDSPNDEGAMANTGFYLAKSDPRVVHYFGTIALSSSTDHDQAVINGNLCTASPHRVAEGGHACTRKIPESNELMTVFFLDKHLFANGSNRAIWGSLGNQTLGERLADAKVPDAYIIHNNWIVGESPKWNRFKDLELLFWDESNKKCVIPEGFQRL